MLGGSASGGLAPYTYSWSPATGLDDETLAQPKSTPSATTIYTLTVTDSLGQTSSDTVTVTLASAVVAEAGADSTVAAGGATTLAGSASGGLAPYTYSWSPTAGLDDPSLAQPRATPSATVTYTLTVTDSLGQTGSDTVTVTVASPAVAEAGPDTWVAASRSVMLQGSASGGLPPYSYSWSPSTGLDDATSPTPQASPTDTTTYTLTVTDSLGQTGRDSMTLQVISFSDVPPAQWAYAQIMACVQAGIVQGYSDGAYHPEYTVTRDQMAVYVARALAGGDSGVGQGPATPHFSDVPVDQWAYKYIEYAYADNIVQGYADGSYGPGITVNRAQMAAFVARSIVSPTGEAGLASYTPPATPSFPDVPTDFWTFKHIEYLKEHNVVSGYSDGDYHPEYDVTRDQMAVFIARAFGLL